MAKFKNFLYEEVKREQSKIPGLKFEVKKVSASRYLKIVHIKSGKDVVRFHSKPIKKLKETYEILNSELSKFNWDVSEEEMQKDLVDRLRLIQSLMGRIE